MSYKFKMVLFFIGFSWLNIASIYAMEDIMSYPSNRGALSYTDVLNTINDGRKEDALQMDIIERLYITDRLLQIKAREHFELVKYYLDEDEVVLSVAEIKSLVEVLFDRSTKYASRLKGFRKKVLGILNTVVDEIFGLADDVHELTERLDVVAIESEREVSFAAVPSSASSTKKRRRKRKKKPASPTSITGPLDEVEAEYIPDEGAVQGESDWDKIRRWWAEIEACRRS